MAWSTGDAIVIVIGLALFALIGAWLQRWAAGHEDQGDDDAGATL